MQKKLFKNNTGQGIVEFALILPILIIIVFGVVDLSRLAYHKSLMNQSAKEIARMASVGNDISSITARAQNMVLPLTGNVTASNSTGTDDQGNSCSIITLSPTLGYTVKVYITPIYSTGIKYGDMIRVSLSYKMDYIVMTNIFGYTASLQANYYTRAENPPL